jgi:LAS superfamily LD-carboxypeptidase LdcB
LGTVVHVSDSPDGISADDFPLSPAGRWLLEHAWEYGFIPALPETFGEAGNWEPWKLRWVGQEMAAHLRKVADDWHKNAVSDELQRVHRELPRQSE